MNSNNNRYYATKRISESSERGYYLEKIDFFEQTLAQICDRSAKPLRILDIGCNDGKLTNKYAKFGDVVGIDINRQGLNRAIKNKKITYICSDISGIKKKYKSYFDVVIAGDIIEHIFDTDQFLDDIKYVLKYKGNLLLTTPNLASLGRRIFLLFGYNPFIEYSIKLPNTDINVGHIRYYTADDLKNQLQFNKYNIARLLGSKINLSTKIAIPHFISKYFPNIAVCLMVHAQKLR